VIQAMANNNQTAGVDATLPGVGKGRQAELRSGVLACMSVLDVWNVKQGWRDERLGLSSPTRW
jgi:hypothetical protein